MAWGILEHESQALEIANLEKRRQDLLDLYSSGSELIHPPERKLATSYYISPDESTVLVGCSNNPWLSKEVAELMGYQLAGTEPARHPNSEVRVRIPFSISEKNMVIIASPGGREVNNEIMEAVGIGDAASRNFGIKRQIVLSKVPYDRQERQSFEEREPILAATVIRMLEEIGEYERAMSFDMHNEGIMGVATFGWDRMYATPLLAERIKRWDLDNPKIISPDAGFVKGAYHYAAALGCPYTNINKYRDPVTGEVSMNGVNGDVAGFDCVIVDDVISSGTTMIEGAQLLIQHGAKSVSLAAAHGEFANSGRFKLYNSDIIRHIAVTNSLPQYPELLAALGMDDKIEVVSIAPYMARGIQIRLQNGSIKREIYNKTVTSGK